MPLDLANYEEKTIKAVQSFWRSRTAAKTKQSQSGKADQGERSGVTAGKNMDGFRSLIVDVIKSNGLRDAEFHQDRKVLTLPGFFRPTKLWDLLVTFKGELIAAIELKSQVGPSFGNNFNNRAEESIGSAHDLWTSYREQAFETQPRPFVGWLMLVEDAPASRTPVKISSPHFAAFKEFEGASYLDRCDLLCQKLVQEQLYTTATLIASPNLKRSGKCSELSELTSIRTLVTTLAGHAAAASARLRAN